MDNEHHGEGVDNLAAGTLHDRVGTRGCGEVLHNHAVDEFYRSMNHHQMGCGVVQHDLDILCEV